MASLGEQAGDLLTKLRDEKPLVHNITNWVVTNLTANALLQIGALPVMAHAREEVEEMVGIAGALVLNIGTLTPPLVDAMLLAGKRANQIGVPVVFDPVGAGATSLRTETSHFLLRELDVDILRGNSGEISVLAGLGGEVKGVEAVASGGERGEIARLAARQFRTVVALTGPTDYVSDGERLLVVENGHPLLAASDRHRLHVHGAGGSLCGRYRRLPAGSGGRPGSLRPGGGAGRRREPGPRQLPGGPC